VKLRIQAVDFHRDIVHINGEKGDGHREIPLNDTSRRIFQELVTKARSKGYEFIFTNPVTGRPFAWLYRGWRQACKLAGIEDLRIHGLRHTFGTRAADEGVRLPPKSGGYGSQVCQKQQCRYSRDGGRNAAGGPLRGSLKNRSSFGQKPPGV
jgi:integrase